MSAPSIPNLLSLRGSGGRRGPAARGRNLHGRGGARPGQSDDSAVQGTDTDAAVSRWSAVNAGYLDDPYARYFVSHVDGPPPRRQPIINRGTYVRTLVLDAAVDSHTKGRDNDRGAEQIVSLGAGTDTRPFRMLSAHQQQEQEQEQELVYHEIDFPVSSSKKLRTVEAVPQLDAILSNRTTGDGGNWSSRPSNGGEYYSHGLDIRSLSVTMNDTLPGLRPELPTLLLSECCLCYLTPDESERVIAYFTSRIPNLYIVLYEPIHLGDPFGETMMSNLAARNIFMPGLERFRNQKDQEERLQKLGFASVRHMTIDALWDSWVREDEKVRVDGLEGLDEVEEWKLLAGHYLVVWGAKDPDQALIF